MTLLRPTVVLAALSMGCALGVAPDIHDTGYVTPPDRWTLPDEGFPDDLDEPMDASTADDAPDGDRVDAADSVAPLDLVLPLDRVAPMDTPTPMDVPMSIDRPATDLGCGVLPGRTCDPGARRSCGNCGTQSCTSECSWSACSGEGTCAAGATRTQPCGNCGTQTQRCSASCAWENVGGCAGSGPCAPGATQGGGCDPCSHQVCQGNCNWGGCTLRPGNACEYQAGRHHRDCGACRCGFQFCLNSCQWSTSCVSCCTTCGGCL